MSQDNNCCQNPELLKNAPEKCTNEQIRICHGDVENHACTCNSPKQEKNEK
ncbi:hypothetical protein HNR65_002534 [Desulfosalsimonas propionicica]|uniref:Uncharacterized protein n=1 Tax=Desulfosalsimonas propionicica TaxID=332175 RepID=A0A7W0CAK0_9BACT|nr:hypothetical protein [Desulfosalsimonas propionicica]MBA2882193.1 hypothetical protein [Desulfosalsimonas propionicica]